MRQAQISPEDTVVLAGAGTLGLGMVQSIRAFFPCRCLVVLDLMEHRLELARRFGADIVINPKKEDAREKVLALTGGVGCDIYIEATGHPAAVQQGLDLIRKAGTFVEFSVMSGPSTIDWSIIGDAKEITIRGSQLSPDCYPDVIEGFRKKLYTAENVVTHRFSLSDWDAAFRTASGRDAVKVILIP